MDDYYFLESENLVCLSHSYFFLIENIHENVFHSLFIFFVLPGYYFINLIKICNYDLIPYLLTSDSFKL